MSTFRFRLATVLKLRESARDELRKRYADALRAEEILNEQEAELVRQQTELADFRRHAAERSVNIDQLSHAQRHAMLLEGERHELQQQKAQVADELERRRQALVEGDRQVRVLEKLRETQEDRHRAEQERQEQRVLDEIAGRNVAGGATP